MSDDTSHIDDSTDLWYNIPEVFIDTEIGRNATIQYWSDYTITESKFFVDNASDIPYGNSVDFDFRSGGLQERNATDFMGFEPDAEPSFQLVSNASAANSINFEFGSDGIQELNVRGFMGFEHDANPSPQMVPDASAAIAGTPIWDPMTNSAYSDINYPVATSAPLSFMNNYLHENTFMADAVSSLSLNSTQETLRSNASSPRQQRGSTGSPSNTTIQSPRSNSNRRPCPREGCFKDFGRKSDLERHIKSVHSNLSYDCTIAGCSNNNGKGYSRPDKLTEHRWKSHEELGYKKTGGEPKK